MKITSNAPDPDSMRHWSVELSYVPRGEKFHTNNRLGILARTATEAIVNARQGIPQGSTDMRIWSVNHHGVIHVIGE